MTSPKVLAFLAGVCGAGAGVVLALAARLFPGDPVAVLKSGGMAALQEVFPSLALYGLHFALNAAMWWFHTASVASAPRDPASREKSPEPSSSAAAVVTLVANTVFSALLSRLLLGERLGHPWRWAIGAAVAGLGATLVTRGTGAAEAAAPPAPDGSHIARTKAD
ncbi:hypothetical protein H696_06220 [Fonticula alba]|uniref:Uncharacterized protein n=1 Tax=Fonticula alba TaxID=691883 RepID=A0A058Z1F1_FONAL|nr:hypothetical protein H696_06220 [Fonticula alba]KCV67352.1 hypothetical protein H696_06220 [Fonticula alba]|eukprot:XP_009498241.1 hypothetical protein H696_06220 [Fonticula alba]